MPHLKESPVTAFSPVTTMHIHAGYHNDDSAQIQIGRCSMAPHVERFALDAFCDIDSYMRVSGLIHQGLPPTVTIPSQASAILDLKKRLRESTGPSIPPTKSS
jgi:hypothetical protein